MSLILMGRRRGGPSGSVSQEITLTATRFASGSGVTAFSMGIPTLASDAETALSSWSLWDASGTTELPCYLENLTGTTRNGRPLSRLLQFDSPASMAQGDSITVRLRIGTNPNVSRLTKRTITWGLSSAATAADIRASVPTNMQGVVMRSASEFCQWEGWAHPLVAWSAITPTTTETAWKSAIDFVLPHMYDGAGLTLTNSNQYSRVYLESAYGAMTGSAAAVWRALTIYHYQKVNYYEPNDSFSGSDNQGAYNWCGVAEQHFASSTGAMAYLLFGDEYARDILVINYARERCFGTSKYHYLHAQTRTGSGNFYNTRQAALGVSYAAWAAKIGAGAVTYNGKTGLAWAREIAANIVAHDAWRTKSVGQAFLTDPQVLNGVEDAEAALMFQTALLMHECLHVHAHPAMGGAVTGLGAKITDAVAFADDIYETAFPSYSPFVPYWDVALDAPFTYPYPSVDTSGLWAGIASWAGSTTFGNTLIDVIGRTPRNGFVGPFMANQNNAAAEKNVQENFVTSVHYFGYKYGSW